MGLYREVHCLATEVFSSGCLSETLNQSLIKLIPKNGACDSIGGWCPISFLCVAYNIMAKDSATRLHEVASYVVWKEYTGSM